MTKTYKPLEEEEESYKLCEPIEEYRKRTIPRYRELSLFAPAKVKSSPGDIKVVELFAGVGGFRIGLERASKRYKTIWNNQWEPSTKRQDASIIYCHRFGVEGHSNEDIATVPTCEIPECNLLVGGFPCQDYSVATTLKRSGGIEGKKGVLWWQIYRILKEYKNKPDYLFFENVDRLLKSPAKQRGRDFAIILASLSDLGYAVEWRVINAADYGMPQRRRRTYILGYLKDSKIYNKIANPLEWILSVGTEAKAFPVKTDAGAKPAQFDINGSILDVSDGFNNGKWTTLVLPFDVTAAQLGAAFEYADECELANIKSMTVTAQGTGSISYVTTNHITANTPILAKIKPNDGLSGKGFTANEYVFTDVKVVNPESAEAVTATSTDGKVTMYGVYKNTARADIDSNSYFLSGGKFYDWSWLSNMTPFTAYIVPQTKTSGNTNTLKGLTFEEDNATGINETLRYENETLRYENSFNLAGQKVGKGYKGMVISKGRKIIDN